MIIETKRLILRNFSDSQEDITALFVLLSDKKVNQYLPWHPVETKEQAKAFYQKRIRPNYEKDLGYHLAICLKEDNTPIGYVGVSREEGHDFGYGLRKEFLGQGLVTEASAAVLEFLKSTDVPFITATHDINNVGSGKVMQKIGLDYKYSYKELWQPKNIMVTFRMYQMNFDQEQTRVYMGYWERYPEHFVEEG
ncbi:hypothetical protein IGI37_003052 [Enterococcus sp. AZ194]|uniref:GNAT family N-acetyltransferase n=1 Tax=Enterococcus sp. AZ194 TaxID=2774629 RepID=UPI003F29F4F7